MMGTGQRNLLIGFSMMLMLGGLAWGAIAIVVGMGADREAARAFTENADGVALTVLLSVAAGAVLRVLLGIDARLGDRN